MHPDKNPTAEAAARFMEIQAAWEVLSDEGRRAALDESYRGGGGGRGQRGYRHGGEHAHPQRGFRERAAEALTSETLSVSKYTFERVVLESSEPWLLQVYADAGEGCQRFAPLWETAARSLEGVVRLGRVDSHAQPTLARQLAGASANDVDALPVLLAFPARCAAVSCAARLRGAERGVKLDALLQFAMDEAAELDAVAQVTLEELDRRFLAAAPAHKVRVLVLTNNANGGAGGAGSTKLRRLATERRATHFVAVARYRDADAAAWRKRLRVRSAPAVVMLAEDGEEPYVHHGAMSYEELVALLSEHGTMALPELRSQAAAAAAGCDAFGAARATGAADARVCLVLVTSGKGGKVREALRAARRATLEAEAPAAEALRTRELAVAWLDAAAQPEASRALLARAGTAEGVSNVDGVVVALWPGSGLVKACPVAVANTRMWRDSVMAWAAQALDGSVSGDNRAAAAEAARLPPLVDMDAPTRGELFSARLRVWRRAAWRRLRGALDGASQGGGWVLPAGGALALLLLPRVLAPPKSLEQQRRERDARTPLQPGRMRPLTTVTEKLIPRRGVYIAVMIKPPDGAPPVDRTALNVRSTHMQHAISQGERLATRFKAEKRLRFVAVNGTTAKGWAALGDRLLSESGLDGAGQAHRLSPDTILKPHLLTVWHPSRSRVCVVGLVPETRGDEAELAAARIERVLDGGGSWVDAEWPAAPKPMATQPTSKGGPSSAADAAAAAAATARAQSRYEDSHVYQSN